MWVTDVPQSILQLGNEVDIKAFSFSLENRHEHILHCNMEKRHSFIVISARPFHVICRFKGQNYD
jgi:hypothetical protein